MRTLLVVHDLEPVEGALLGPQVTLRRTRRRGFECPMHALVLGTGGENALVLNPQPHPPDVERRQAVNAGGCEGHPVIGPNGPRQPVLAKSRSKTGRTPTPWVDSRP
jgi:hypothetical protein